MKQAINLTTAAVFHMTMTLGLTLALVYGVYVFLGAHPAIDSWLGRELGWNGWGFVAVIITVAYIMARTISLYFTSRVVLPWLSRS